MSITAASLPPVFPSDRALRDAEAPTRYDLAQQVTALRAENRSLSEQLHRHAENDERHRRAIDDMTAALIAATTEETT